jgi:hypothetical protein
MTDPVNDETSRAQPPPGPGSAQPSIVAWDDVPPTGDGSGRFLSPWIPIGAVILVVFSIFGSSRN